jgi:cytochrome c oxidase subunit 3
MSDAVAHHSHHETSNAPFFVGMGVVLTALTILSFSQWQSPTAGIVLGGITLALMAIGLTLWSREFFKHGIEEGFGTIAVAWFIVSEVIIFGTMFAAFWYVRINLADVWAGYIPAGMNLGLAGWLTLILWASSATIVLAERAFEHGKRASSQFWLLATFALGLLFVVLHMQEWMHLAHEGFKVGANAYANTFYGLTGVHTSHVIVGLLIQIVLFGVLATGLMKTERATLFRGASLYWHFVDLMWLLVAGNAYIIGSKL